MYNLPLFHRSDMGPLPPRLHLRPQPQHPHVLRAPLPHLVHAGIHVQPHQDLLLGGKILAGQETRENVVLFFYRVLLLINI